MYIYIYSYIHIYIHHVHTLRHRSKDFQCPIGGWKPTIYLHRYTYTYHMYIYIFTTHVDMSIHCLTAFGVE